MRARCETINRIICSLALAALFLVTSAAWTKSEADVNALPSNVAVSATSLQTYALKSNGELWVWGYNYYGQLGLGVNDTSDRSVPTQLPVPGGSGYYWKAIANGVGENHFGAIRSDGTLWMWGLNSSGQLGNNGTSDSHVPVQVFGLENDWAAVAVGNSHTVALKADGRLYTWGSNANGKLGDGGTSTERHTPYQVAGTWTAIGAGFAQTMGLKNDGTLWAWGFNSQGQLGDQTSGSPYNDRTLPSQVGGPTTGGWAKFSIGSGHTLALKSDGSLYVWGVNYYGELGNGNAGYNAYWASPLLLSGGWTAVASSAGNHSLAIQSNGSLWVWGLNSDGQLGLGDSGSPATDRHVPTQNVYATNWIYVSGGQMHSAAVKTNGSLHTWGDNYYGQLGNNATPSDSPTPVYIFNLDKAPPYVSATSPGNGTTNIPVSAPISATVKDDFSGLVQGTITMYVTPGVSGNPQKTCPDTNTCNISLSANLNYGQTYTVTVGGTDVAGNAMGAFSFGFTTQHDTTGPVITVSVKSNAPTNPAVSLTVSDPESGYNDLSVAVQYSTNQQNWNAATRNAGTLDFTIPGTFAYGQRIYIRASAQNGDVTLPQTTVQAFDFTIPPDTTAPGLSTTPLAGSNNVAVNQEIKVVVSDAQTGIRGTPVMMVNGITVSPTITGNSSSYTLTYSPGFSYGQTVNVEVIAEDNATNRLDQTFLFTTLHDISAPLVSITSPSSGATGISRVNPVVTLQVSDNESGVNDANIKVQYSIDGGTNWTDAVRQTGTLKFTLNQTFGYKQTVNIRARASNNDVSQPVWSSWTPQPYTFETQADTSAPSASLIAPIGTTSDLKAKIEVEVSDGESGVDPATLGVSVASSALPTDQDPHPNKTNVPINAFSWTVSGNKYSATIIPTNDLLLNKAIYVTIAAKDLAGNQTTVEPSFSTQSKTAQPTDDGDGISATWKERLQLTAATPKRTLFIKPLQVSRDDSTSPPTYSYTYWSDFKTKYLTDIEGYFNTEFEARARRGDGTAVGLQIRVIGDDANPYAPMRALDYDPTKDSLYCPLVNGQHQCATGTSPPVTILTIEAHKNYDVSGTQSYGHTQFKSVTQPDPQAPFELGTATSGGASTLSDTTKSWTANGWVDKYVIITSGLGVSQTRRITANTATTLTVDPAWTTIPNNTSAYYVGSTISYYTWSWQTKGFTTSTGSTPPATSTAPPRTGYNGPAQAGLRALNHYMTEGAYTSIAKDSSACTTNCWSPACCLVTNVSTNDYIDINNNPTDMVAFNRFTFSAVTLAQITGPLKTVQGPPALDLDYACSTTGYSNDAVLTHTLIHEIIHALLTAQDADHCENPCCPMHSGVSRERGWTITGLGASTCEITYKDGTKSNFANRRCTHNNGGLNDITYNGTVYNASH